jgi:hypothetical protein
LSDEMHRGIKYAHAKRPGWRTTLLATIGVIALTSGLHANLERSSSHGV